MTTEHESYWIMVASDVNCAILAEMGFPYYAMKMGGNSARIARSDRCALYRVNKGRGFIGIFEALEPAKQTPTRVGIRTFPMRLPWRPIITCESNPVDLKSIVERLTFIKDPRHAGAYFQRSILRISAPDFSAIEESVKAHSRSSH